jgi:hypothetical protein
VSVRRLAALFPLLAVLLLGSTLTSPADAAVMPTVVPDPVTVVVGTVTQGQNQGSDPTWVVPVSWQAADTATGYTVKLTSLDGTSTYATRDVSGTSTTFTTANLLENTDYLASVAPFNGDGPGTAATDQFTAITLDRTAPTGTFTVAPTHAWLTFDFLSLDESESASVTNTQVASYDDTSSTITRRVLAGDGTAWRTWPSGSSIAITYTTAGTYTPKVELTDGYGNSGTIDLSPVTVSNDVTAPVVRVTPPATAMRDRIAGWRRIRGTATDSGSGVELAVAMVLEKRAGIWYAYDFHHRKWLKGWAREGKTLRRTKATPALLIPSSTGQWHTSWIRGLRTGKLSVHAAALDASGNIALAPVARAKITRR